MLSKVITLKIGEDEVHWMDIKIDEKTKLPLSDSMKNFYNTIMPAVKVVDITNYTEIPQIGSIWDGKNFLMVNDELPLFKLDKNLLNFPKFAFIDKDNKFTGMTTYEPAEGKHAERIAMLQSDPEIVITERFI
jgi:hypothetical protein